MWMGTMADLPYYNGSRQPERYPRYTDSGVEWLGDIPAHWEVRRLGAVGRIAKCGGGTKAHDVMEGIPCVRYGDLYTHHDFSITRSRAFVSVEHAAAYSAIQYGDLLFAASGETIDEIGKSSVNLMGGEALCGGDIILLRPAIPVEARFLGYTTNAPYMRHQKSRLGRGMTILHIYGQQLKNATMLLPPVPEQHAIADFLDREIAKIDALVEKQLELMGLLGEKRTALIGHTVTKGLDSDVAMKDSGVEWLGEIPAHWDVAALRYRYEQTLGKMLDTKRITGNHLVPYLRNVDVQWDQINLSDLPSMDIGPHEIERFTVRPGDLLVCEGGEAGRCAIWQGDLDPCGYQKALHRLRPLTRGRERPRFLYYTLAAAVARGAFADGQGSTIAHLTGDMLRAHRFPFPPTAEQSAVADLLDQETTKIDAITAKINEAIERLCEYRTALIAAAVTGKIDVRHHVDHMASDNTPPTQARP